MRRKLAAGIDPAEERRSNGATPAGAGQSNTFEAIAREWFAKHSPTWAPGHGDKIIRRLESNIFPWLKKDSIRDIKPLELLAVIQRIEQRGRNETARRALQNCGRVLIPVCSRYWTRRARHHASIDEIPSLRAARHPGCRNPRELEPLTGSGRFVFPGERDHNRAMSNNTVNAALRGLGDSNTEMTGHGFRSMASTLLNEQGWHPDAIERQLAHQEPNEIRATYNYAKHLPERRRIR